MQFGPYLLRPIAADDAAAFFHLIDTNRTRLEDFFSGTVAATRTLADTERHVAKVLAQAADRSYFGFALIDTRTGAMAGYTDIKRFDWRIPKAELGAFLDAAHAGHGIGAQMLEAITHFGFRELGLKKLLIRTHESNTGARRIAEKNGYVLEGLIRSDHCTTAGVVLDLMYYGKVRGDATTKA